jgi:hypothetical protein
VSSFEQVVCAWGLIPIFINHVHLSFITRYTVVNTDGSRITCALGLHSQPTLKFYQDLFGMATKIATTTQEKVYSS